MRIIIPDRIITPNIFLNVQLCNTPFRPLTRGLLS